MKNICFVTSNEGKLREARQILGIKIDSKSIDVNEIQAIDVEDVVKEKALEAYKAIKRPVMVEDTGLAIDDLNGFPGALIKWVLKTIPPERICRIVGKNRKTRVKIAIALYNGKKLEVFIGDYEGTLPKKPRGKHGFGWDSLFVPKGYKKTYGELTPEEKNAISVRSIALKKMKSFLDKHPEFLE